jgi:hypothetical protein
VVPQEGASWARPYINQTDLASLVDEGTATVGQGEGDLASAPALPDLFDRFMPASNITVPPTYH